MFPLLTFRHQFCNFKTNAFRLSHSCITFVLFLGVADLRYLTFLMQYTYQDLIPRNYPQREKN